MRMMSAGHTPVIGGPAVYAALGMHYANIRTALLTAVGNDLLDFDNVVINFLDDKSSSLKKKLKRPMLVWNSPLILGNTGRGMFSDDPCLWRNIPSDFSKINGNVIVLANGDPDWYEKLLSACSPMFIFMDLHMEWFQVRRKSLNTCFKKANVITMTENEYKELPVEVKSGVIFEGNKKTLIIKRGIKGVSIITNSEHRDLPSPMPSLIKTDVGCGDFLIGSLAGHFMSSCAQKTRETMIDRLSQAYLNSIDKLEKLMESDGAEHFMHACIDELMFKGVVLEI